MAKKRATRAEWFERVREWKASGQPAEAFAKRAKLSRRSLEWWAWKLGSEGEELEPKARSKSKARSKRQPRSKSTPKSSAASGRVDFVELLAIPGAAAGVALRVSGVVVEVHRDFDSEVLGRVLDVLEARR